MIKSLRMLKREFGRAYVAFYWREHKGQEKNLSEKLEDKDKKSVLPVETTPADGSNADRGAEDSSAAPKKSIFQRFHGRKKETDPDGQKNRHKIFRKPSAREVRTAILSVLIVLAVTLAVFLIFTCRWAFTTWSNLKMDEIIFELSEPLEGTGDNMISGFLTACVLPAGIAAAAVIVLLALLRKKSFIRRMRLLLGLGGLAGIVAAVSIGYTKLDIGNWWINRNKDSSFIEDNYVDPSTTTITFPEKKRNLIYIYLESMEMTYADKGNGGGFDFNCIPELTQLAEENEDFSGSSDKLNGSYAMNGATWTMGGIFAQTSGLPLKTSLGNNGMSTQTSFFPSITTLGDILQQQGYQQVFMLGSNATFGGRRLYFTDHGNYNIMDYLYAKEVGWIPANYKVWWGYEDEKLFSYAKNELSTLGSSDQPFNFTMLTVDTHFPNGYVCELCPTTFGDNQYANVMACSSAQVYSFIQWIQQQPWYDNTTIVISGDHLTMDGDFCNDVSSDYNRRVYTCYINADATVANPDKKRTYTTFDDFPTTLAALGCTIDGDSLGLGTNLFADKKTLTEKYGVTEMNTELSRKSSFMTKLAGISAESQKVSKEMNKSKPKIKVTYDDDNVYFVISNLEKIEDDIGSLYVSIYDDSGERLLMHSATLQTDGTYWLGVARNVIGTSGKYTLRLHVDSAAGDIYIGKTKSFSLPD